jgi:DNA-binding Lrp family transcriptional regulator
MNKKFKIHDQISEKQIITAIESDFSNFMQSWFQLQFAWIHNAYNSFKDIEKYLILLYLVNTTLKTYNKHFYNLSYDDFYANKSIDIEKISVIEIVKDLGMAKETVRRKLNEMTNEKIIIRKGKQISIQQNALIYQKPIISIKNFSKLVACVTKEIDELKTSYSEEYLEREIKKNYTHYWHIFLNFQIDWVLAQKDFFKNLENLVVFSVIVLNQTYNLKNSSDPNFQSKSDSAMSDYAEMLTNYTLSNSKGLNPTTISELTGVPRASVIRKLKDLEKENLVTKSDDNLFTISTEKTNLKGFLELKKTTEQVHLKRIELIKEIINLTIN